MASTLHERGHRQCVEGAPRRRAYPTALVAVACGDLHRLGLVIGSELEASDAATVLRRTVLGTTARVGEHMGGGDVERLATRVGRHEPGVVGEHLARLVELGVATAARAESDDDKERGK